MDNIHEANWTQGEGGLTLDSPLNIEMKQDGSCRLFTADGKFEQNFSSPDEATEAFGALLQRGTQTS